MLGACSHNPSMPQNPAPRIGNGYPERLNIASPSGTEIIVVINDNDKMVHSGMFAAARLFDPAGSYLGTRSRDQSWQGSSLEDYVRFQLDDGPMVKLYRFKLPKGQFSEVVARIDDAGITIPLFCAARVQNIVSGIGPFEAVPNTWLASPAALAEHLDTLISQHGTGNCYWPDGSSCNPVTQPKEARIAQAPGNSE